MTKSGTQGTPTERVDALEKLKRLEKVVERLKALTEKYRQAEVVQQALFRISELASSAQSMEQLYSSVHKIVAQLMEARNFYICLYNEDRSSFSFPYFADEYDTPEFVAEVPAESLMNGMTGYILRSAEPLLCTGEDIQSLNDSGDVTTMGSLPVDWMGAPLILADDVIGAMVVQSYVDDVRYQHEDLELLTFVSQHVANALERFRQREWMEREIQHQTSELRFANESLLKEVTDREKAEQQTSVLYAISELTNTAEDMRGFYSDLHRQIDKLLNADNFYIALLTENGQQVYFPYYIDESGSEARQRRLQKGLTEYVLRTGRPAFVNAQRRDELIRRGEVVRASDHGKLAHEWLGSPLTMDGEVFGVLAVQSYSEEQKYSKDDLELLNFVSQHVAVAIERRRSAEKLARANVFLEKRIAERTEELVEEIERRKKIEARLFHDAHHDNLTGLPNRAMFTDRVKQALSAQKRRSKEYFAILFVDLDRFKNINDTLGHSAGDKFLLEVSERLSSMIREHDLLARLGGDEFVILLDRINHIDDVKDISARIIEVMKEPFVLEGQEHFSGASIGIANYRDEHDTVERLLRDADAAMYEAKSMGRGRYVVFDETIRSGLVAAINQETALRHAQVNEDFILWYQPVQDLETRSNAGFELLLRWKKGNELIQPKEFLELAERSGAILEMDAWMLTQASELLAAREAAGESTAPIHINLSVQHLLRNRHIQRLIDIVEAAKVNPTALVFEFDEESLQNEDARRILASLRKLKDQGFQLALDDFGKGAGPLQFIYNYPFDIVKLDHRFVAQVNKKDRAQAMVRHVVTLCEELGIRLTAEGVENNRQLEKLTDLGVHFGQGYYLGAPQEVQSEKSELRCSA
ncbi:MULTISPECIES: EAL domain-containing protein [Gammaproteobacteria]|uniref:bifunctional diguanylate cyclase/phosphodiesterase n=1 Tax=Gammaproteobacteria TaxID=1236 RepID=UPI000DD0C729|nr:MULTISPECIES: EAL domain-containing protein [Gammaproteobacteria]RTE86545.1 EAL domain-containing protein [Aliidiomarina sp. B3213]TCZ90900.1 EAL domain-containing protein [Lysobacter sp. N42]